MIDRPLLVYSASLYPKNLTAKYATPDQKAAQKTTTASVIFQLDHSLPSSHGTMPLPFSLFTPSSRTSCILLEQILFFCKYKKRPAPTGPAFSHKHLLVLDKWHKSHKACALDCCREISLPLGSKSSSATIHHTSMWVHHCRKTVDVFEVNVVVNAVFCFCFFHILIFTEYLLSS